MTTTEAWRDDDEACAEAADVVEAERSLAGRAGRDRGSGAGHRARRPRRGRASPRTRRSCSAITICTTAEGDLPHARSMPAGAGGVIELGRGFAPRADQRQPAAMKILLSMAACQPDQGPGPAVGWNMVQQVARHHQVWVLTHAGNRAAIEAAVRRQSAAAGAVLLRPWPGRAAPGARRPVARRRSLAAARLSPGAPSARRDRVRSRPSGRSLAIGRPPACWPCCRCRSCGARSTATNRRGRAFARGSIDPVGSRAWLGALGRQIAAHDPLVRLTARRSAIVLASTKDAAARVRALGAARVELRGASGITAEAGDTLAGLPPPPAAPIRFLSIGALRPGSGLALGLAAFAEAALPDAEYWVVGDGPQRRRLQRLARRAGIADRVHFFGAISRAEVVDALRKCHVLVHGALQDASGEACLDAMAAGRPVVCLDLGAPALQVTDQTGIKVRADAPERTVEDLAGALRRLAADAELRLRLGAGGRARVHRIYNWNSKGRALVRLYEQILASTPSVRVTDAHSGGSQSLPDPRRRGRIRGGGAGAPAPEWP